MQGNQSQSISTTLRWLLQAFTGVLLILLLGVHMIANHFVVQGGLRTYDEVVAYLSNPVILVWEAIFLITVTFHAMLGLRSILYDLGPSATARRWIDGLVIGIGIVAVVYGLWLLILLGT